MKKSLILGLVLIMVVVSATGAFAFQKGEKYLGVSLGLNYTDSNAILGANLEIALNNNWGFGGLVRYWSFDDFGSYIYIAAQGNYHFKFGGPKLDLYAGLALGYGIFNSTYDWYTATSSTLYFSLQVGARYKLTDSLYLTGRLLGGQLGTFEAGIDYRF